MIPIEIVAIDQDAHELRYGDGGMRVIELDRHFLRQAGERTELLDMAAHQIPQRRRDEEIFLAQAQFLSGWRAVGRIEDLRDRLRPVLFGERPQMIAAIEGIAADPIERLGTPKPQ